MRINNLNNIQSNFKGVKNIIAGHMYDKNNNGFLVLSCQFDNEKTNDLDEFRKILYNSPNENKKFDDCLSTILNYDKNGYRGLIFENQIVYGNLSLNSLRLELDDDLLFENIEKRHLRLQTFIAHLTKKISNMNLIKQDNGIENVIRNTQMFLYKINPKTANTILLNIAAKYIPPQMVAGDMNKLIHNNMMKYLKI